MGKEQIYYKKGYKYQIVEDYTIQTNVIRKKEDPDILSEYIILYNNGILTIKKAYCFDGPSGPTIDTKNFMRGSLVHDVLYQLIREKKLEKKWRKQADIELYRICLEDGMSKIRAWYVFYSVRMFAQTAASPANKKKILIAP